MITLQSDHYYSIVSEQQAVLYLAMKKRWLIEIGLHTRARLAYFLYNSDKYLTLLRSI